MRISDWSSDVCSSDLARGPRDRDSGGYRNGHSIDSHAWPHNHHSECPCVELRTFALPTDDQCHSHVLRRVMSRNNSRSEEQTSELPSLMRISYAVFCLKKKKSNTPRQHTYRET